MYLIEFKTVAMVTKVGMGIRAVRRGGGGGGVGKGGGGWGWLVVKT